MTMDFMGDAKRVRAPTELQLYMHEPREATVSNFDRLTRNPNVCEMPGSGGTAWS